LSKTLCAEKRQRHGEAQRKGRGAAKSWRRVTRRIASVQGRHRLAGFEAQVLESAEEIAPKLTAKTLVISVAASCDELHRAASARESAGGASDADTPSTVDANDRHCRAHMRTSIWKQRAMFTGGPDLW